MQLTGSLARGQSAVGVVTSPALMFPYLGGLGAYAGIRGGAKGVEGLQGEVKIGHHIWHIGAYQSLNHKQ